MERSCNHGGLGRALRFEVGQNLFASFAETGLFALILNRPAPFVGSGLPGQLEVVQWHATTYDSELSAPSLPFQLRHCVRRCRCPRRSKQVFDWVAALRAFLRVHDDY